MHLLDKIGEKLSEQKTKFLDRCNDGLESKQSSHCYVASRVNKLAWKASQRNKDKFSVTNMLNNSSGITSPLALLIP